mmetsp:Transcript_15316/g.37890  ORF Transcript_15316/g.37890 Transcript_15316/m.37890 type:complete len:462 (+) Transcript_15316:443-1828(+)
MATASDARGDAAAAAAAALFRRLRCAYCDATFVHFAERWQHCRDEHRREHDRDVLGVTAAAVDDGDETGADHRRRRQPPPQQQLRCPRRDCAATFADAPSLQMHIGVVHGGVGGGVDDGDDDGGGGDCAAVGIGDRPYVCRVDNCHRSYQHQSSLYAHVRVFHAGVVSRDGGVALWCPIRGCDRVYTSESARADHLHARHGDASKPAAAVHDGAGGGGGGGGRMLECSECNRVYRDLSSLRNHALSHHRNIRYACAKCGVDERGRAITTYSHFSSLKNHLRMHRFAAAASTAAAPAGDNGEERGAGGGGGDLPIGTTTTAAATTLSDIPTPLHDVGDNGDCSSRGDHAGSADDDDGDDDDSEDDAVGGAGGGDDGDVGGGVGVGGALRLMCPHADDCKRAFSSVAALRNHLRVVHQGVRYRCCHEQCTLEFTTRRRLLRHQRSTGHHQFLVVHRQQEEQQQ